MPTQFIQTVSEYLMQEVNQLIKATEGYDKTYALIRHTDVSEKKLTKDEEVVDAIKRYSQACAPIQWQFKQGPFEGELLKGEIYIWLKAPYELCLYEENMPIQKNTIYIQIIDKSCFAYRLIDLQGRSVTKHLTRFELNLTKEDDLTFETIQKFHEQLFSILADRKDTSTTYQRVFYTLQSEQGVVSDYLDFQPDQKMQFFPGEHFMQQIEQRKNIILRLIRKKGFIPDPDKDAWQHFTNILSDAKTFILTQDRSSKLLPKQHADCYEKLKRNMDFIEADFREANLNNFFISGDKSTYYEDQLKYFLARYLFDAVINPSTSLLNVSPEKQKAVNTALLKCEKNLMELDRRLILYDEYKKEFVTECVKEIALENVTICNNHTYRMFGLSTGPSPGRLRKSLKKIATEVLEFESLEALLANAEIPSPS